MTAALCLHVVIFLAVVAAQTAAFRVNLFHPSTIYLFFHMIVFVLRPIFVTALDFNDVYNYMRYYPSTAVSIQTLWITDVALVSFVATAGFVSFGCRKLGNVWASEPVQVESRQVRSAFRLVCLVLGGPVLISILFAITHPVAHAHEGALAATDMVEDAATGVTTYTNTTGYLTDLQSLAGSICLAWAYLKRFRLLHLIPFGVYVLLRASEGGGRFAFLLLSVALALAFLLSRRQVFPNGRILVSWIVVGSILFSLFAAIGNDRKVVRRALGWMDATEQALYEKDDRKQNLLNSSILENDFANYEFLEYVVHVVPGESGTYSFFRQYLDVFIWPIPRVLWPQKPVLGAVNPIQFNDYGNFRALTYSLVGDGWMSLGYFGVVFTLGFAGLVCGSLYNVFAKGAWRSPIGGLAYCTFLVLTPQWFRDGGVTIVLFCGEQLALFALWGLAAQKHWIPHDPRSWIRPLIRPGGHTRRFTRALRPTHGWRVSRR